MSDEGEKTCPLCAEEMDMTDQQLKPCKCGYEICVWCWHHIMEMAEKDETEGRCPACRTPYDKEKIVGTAANCERLVAETSVEKKKSQKAKMKTSEGRKQLSSVRVIQRNLVYIVGLPLNLADEDLLLRKEYFGQYGKVLKVSMSRTSAGTIQQFPNSTCSVYITYSKEEEAVRCIQSIHGFTLEGRTLRACFGTTKYCHAWLRNVPCTNPDCLYLHEVGSQEDSFTKDEIISAYSRVQQITGIANSMQRRSGSVLPPPADECCNNSSATSGKPSVKNTSTSLVSSARVSPPASSAGRSGALPAAASWGARASACQSSAGGLACSNGPEKQKPDAAGAPLGFSAAVAGLTQSSVQSNDLGKKVILSDDGHPKETKSKPKPPENLRQHATGVQTNMSEDSHVPFVAHAAPMAKGRQPSPPARLGSNKTRHSIQEQPNVVGMEKERTFTSDKKSQNSCSDASSISIDKPLTSQSSEVKRPNGLSLDCFLVPRDQGLQQYNDTKLRESMESPVSKANTSTDGADALKRDVQSSAVLNLQSEKDEDFDIQRLSDAIVTQTSLPSSSYQYNLLNHLRSPSHQFNDASGAINHNVNPVVNRQGQEHLASVASNTLVASNGLVDGQVQFRSVIGNSCVLPGGLHGHRIGVSENGADNVDLNPGMDGIESSIISNILSLDLDTWDDSLTSPQDLVKLLGENERQQGSFNLSSSWKGQNSNQSRFSFARQEEPRGHAFNVETSFNSRAGPHLLNHALLENREPYLDRLGNGFDIAQRNAEQYDGFGGSQAIFPTNKHSAVSRSQVSAPPGFSAPSRLPPPGFSSHGRNDPTFDVRSGNHYFESSPLRSPYQASPSSNTGSVADIEFIDPAILAVGKGRPPSSLSNSNIDMSPFLSQTSAFENDSRFQLLMQKSAQPHQNLRYADIGDNYTPNDAPVFSSRRMEPLQNGSLSFSQFANQSRGGISSNHWDNWPEVMAGNNMGMSELLRNDRPGFNQLYSGYEESKFQMPGSADMYNRTYGI